MTRVPSSNQIMPRKNMIINPQGKQLFLTNGCTVGQKVGFMNSIGNYVSLKITLTVNFTCNLGSMLMAIRCGC